MSREIGRGNAVPPHTSPKLARRKAPKSILIPNSNFRSTRSAAKTSAAVSSVPKPKSQNNLGLRRSPRRAAAILVPLKEAPPSSKQLNNASASTLASHKDRPQSRSPTKRPTKKLGASHSPAFSFLTRPYDPEMNPVRASPTKSTMSGKSVYPRCALTGNKTVSYFSAKGCRDNTMGPLASAIAVGMDKYDADMEKQGKSPTGASLRARDFVGKLLHADEKRYKFLDPELDSLKFPISYITVGLMTVIFIVMVSVGDENGNRGFVSPTENPMLGPTIDTMLRFGGNVSNFTRASFSTYWWTLITANYLHVGVVHLVLNSVALLVMGPKMDRWYGSVRVGIIFFLSGVCGYIANSLIRNAPVAALGASGSICGLLGAIMAEGIRNWDSMNLPVLQLITCILQNYL
ncbi:MAG: hypothetical protein SGCHY_002976 [Lobulomycetales sp.]